MLVAMPMGMIMVSPVAVTVGMFMGMGVFVLMGMVVALPMVMAMAMTVILQMGVGMVVIMGVVMPATAIGAVFVHRMIVCAMIMMSMLVMPMLVAGMRIGPGFGLERAGDMMGLTALSAHHFCQHVIVLDIDRLRSDFGGRMTVADVPRHFQQPQRIVGLDFQQRFGGGFDEDQRTILELQRIAIIQDRRFVEIEQKACAFIALQYNPPLMAALVIERNLVNHLLVFHGGLADNACGALHGFSLSEGLNYLSL